MGRADSKGRRNGKHGRVEFKLGGGETLRAITEVIDHGQKQVADRYDFAVARDYDAVSQVEAMEREGLDVAVLFRTSPLHCDETLEADYANELCRAWNSWIADFCKVNPDRLKASALITLHDVDLAVAEVRRVTEQLGIRALSLCPEPINGKRIHDRYFDPLWAEIEKRGVALCFHPPARPKQDQVANKFFGHPNANIIALALRNPVELIQAVSSSVPAASWKNFPSCGWRFSRAIAPGCLVCFIASMSGLSCTARWPTCPCRANQAITFCSSALSPSIRTNIWSPT